MPSMLAMSAAVLARRQAVCETSFICRLSGCQKKCALPKPFEPIVVGLLLVFPSRQYEFACPVPSFLVGDTVSSGGKRYKIWISPAARRATVSSRPSSRDAALHRAVALLSCAPCARVQPLRFSIVLCLRACSPARHAPLPCPSRLRCHQVAGIHHQPVLRLYRAPLSARRAMRSCSR